MSDESTSATYASAMRAVRGGATFHVSRRAALLEVSGRNAGDVLDRCVPCALTLYDAQARSTLFLDATGSVVADVTIARFEGAYWLIVDGLTAEETTARVVASRSPGDEVEITDLRATKALVSLHGPYVWQLLAAWLGRSAVAVPPLAFLRVKDAAVLRAGRTGEYGYEVFVPRESLDEVIASLRTLGEALDLVEAPLAVLDACATEVGGFVIRHVGGHGLSPIELQLQWRLARDKPLVRALLDRRRAEAMHRITWFVATEAVSGDAELRFRGEPSGRVLFTERAVLREGVFGVALIDARVAHPRLTFETAEGELRTASPPLVQPISRRVRPNLDHYRRVT